MIRRLENTRDPAEVSRFIGKISQIHESAAAGSDPQALREERQALWDTAFCPWAVENLPAWMRSGAYGVLTLNAFDPSWTVPQCKRQVKSLEQPPSRLTAALDARLTLHRRQRRRAAWLVGYRTTPSRSARTGPPPTSRASTLRSIAIIVLSVTVCVIMLGLLGGRP